MFLTHGVSGSGKSFFAQRLAEEIGDGRLAAEAHLWRGRHYLDLGDIEPGRYGQSAGARLYGIDAERVDMQGFDEVIADLFAPLLEAAGGAPFAVRSVDFMADEAMELLRYLPNKSARLMEQVLRLTQDIAKERSGGAGATSFASGTALSFSNSARRSDTSGSICSSSFSVKCRPSSSAASPTLPRVRCSARAMTQPPPPLCPGPAATATPASGSTFPIGTNAVTAATNVRLSATYNGVTVNVPSRADLNRTDFEKTRVWNWLARFDNQLNANQTWSLRMLWESSPQANQVNDPPSWTAARAEKETDTDWTLVGTMNSVLGSRTVNTFRLSAVREDVFFGNPQYFDEGRQDTLAPTLDYLSFEDQQSPRATARLDMAYGLDDTLAWFASVSNRRRSSSSNDPTSPRRFPTRIVPATPASPKIGATIASRMP